MFDIKQSSVLLNHALVSLNMGASFWILTLDPIEMGPGLARAYEDRVAGKEKPWATPFPIHSYCKP